LSQNRLADTALTRLSQPHGIKGQVRVWRHPERV
jgi:hypothetical protein